MLALPPHDEAAIRALFETLREAWAQSDGEAFASAFAEDADFINIMAQAMRGRTDIARHHTQLFATMYRGTTASFHDLRIRLIAPGVATVETPSAVKLPDGTERHAHMLIVAVRGPSGWRIQALHNMIPFKPPQG